MRTSARAAADDADELQLRTRMDADGRCAANTDLSRRGSKLLSLTVGRRALWVWGRSAAPIRVHPRHPRLLLEVHPRPAPRAGRSPGCAGTSAPSTRA